MISSDIDALRKKHPVRITRAKAIKLYCKELCCCGETDSWKNCQIKSCFLWVFRKGKEENVEIHTKEKMLQKNDSFTLKNQEKNENKEGSYDAKF